MNGNIQIAPQSKESFGNIIRESLSQGQLPGWSPVYLPHGIQKRAARGLGGTSEAYLLGWSPEPKHMGPSAIFTSITPHSGRSARGIFMATQDSVLCHLFQTCSFSPNHFICGSQPYGTAFVITLFSLYGLCPQCSLAGSFQVRTAFQLSFNS